MRDIRAGEHWAYREKRGAPLEEVQIIKLGVKRRSYAFLAFLSPEQEALEAWRPIQRLIVPWGERDLYLALEAAMDAADASSPNLTAGELSAIDFVIGAAGAEACLDTSLGASGALLRITDSRLLRVKLGPDVADLPAHPLSFTDKEGLVVPWTVGEWIVGGLARRFREECLTDAEACDEQIRDIRLTRSDRHGELREPDALKMSRELRDISETIRRWVNGPLIDYPQEH